MPDPAAKRVGAVKRASLPDHAAGAGFEQLAEELMDLAVALDEGKAGRQHQGVSGVAGRNELVQLARVGVADEGRVEGARRGHELGMVAHHPAPSSCPDRLHGPGALWRDVPVSAPAGPGRHRRSHPEAASC